MPVLAMEGTTTPMFLPESPQGVRSYNLPEPLTTERPYEEPPAPKNPVLRGLSLTLSAKMYVAAISILINI